MAIEYCEFASYVQAGYVLRERFFVSLFYLHMCFTGTVTTSNFSAPYIKITSHIAHSLRGILRNLLFYSFHRTIGGTGNTQKSPTKWKVFLIIKPSWQTQNVPQTMFPSISCKFCIGKQISALFYFSQKHHRSVLNSLVTSTVFTKADYIFLIFLEETVWLYTVT